MNMTTQMTHSKSKLKYLLNISKNRKNFNQLHGCLNSKSTAFQVSFDHHQQNVSHVVGRQIYAKDCNFNKRNQLFDGSLSKKTSIFHTNPQSLNGHTTINKSRIINLPKSFGKIKNKHNMNFTGGIVNCREYGGRHTSKESSQNLDTLNQSSPLSIWKQVTKSFKRAHTQTESNYTSNESPTRPPPATNKKLSDIEITILINNQNHQNKQNAPLKNPTSQQSSSKQLKELIDNWKSAHYLGESDCSQKRKNENFKKRKQQELERSVLMRKSLSCGSGKRRVEQYEAGEHDHGEKGFVTGQQKEGMLSDKINPQSKSDPNNPTPTSKPHPNPGSHLHPHSTDPNPIVLIHKQPLQDYLPIFFTPLAIKNPQQLSNPFCKPFSKPHIHSLIKIKPKKLSTRNFQKLQKLKKNLFRDRSYRELFAGNGTGTNQSSLRKLNQRKKEDGNIFAEFRSFKQSMEGAKGCEEAGNSDAPDDDHYHHQTFYNRLQTECAKHLEKEGHHDVNGKMTRSSPDAQKIPLNSTYTPSIKKVSPSSSVISFSEQPTPEKQKVNMKGQAFFNAW